MNPLSTGQVALYMALLHVCNRSNWAEWFQAQNQVLSILTGLSRSGILKARNELKQRGLIDFRERGTKATLYRITIANSKQESAQDGNQKGAQDCNQESAQNSGTLKDKDRDREGERDRMRAPVVEHFDAFWSAYPKHGNDRPAAERAYCKVLREDCHVTEQDLVAAAVNYAEAMESLEREEKYIRSGASFLTDSFFVAYLPGQYTGPEKRRKVPPGNRNSFNQFPQHEYDFGTLEAELVDNWPGRKLATEMGQSGLR